MAFDSTENKWNDLTIFLNGVKITKVTGLKYKSSQEAEEIYAAGDDPIDIQTGNRTYQGTLTLLKAPVDDMNRAAKAGGFRDLMDVPWVIIASYKATAANPIQVDTLPNVRITDYEKGMEQNAKSMPIGLPFKCLAITNT